jgi:hypothetical protein
MLRLPGCLRSSAWPLRHLIARYLMETKDTPQRYYVDRRANRVQQRWWLLYILACNPSLRANRKWHLEEGTLEQFALWNWRARALSLGAAPPAGGVPNSDPHTSSRREIRSPNISWSDDEDHTKSAQSTTPGRDLSGGRHWDTVRQRWFSPQEMAEI